jgi:hypothetical protein
MRSLAIVGAADRAERQHSEEVVAPGEMLVPVIVARVEQADLLPGQRIRSCGEVVLQSIAVGAGGGKVLGAVDVLVYFGRGAASSPQSGRDVIDLELPNG